MKYTAEEIRQAAEADLLAFIRLLAPHLLLGQAHIDLINWWQSSTRKQNRLVLFPRGHLKSKLMAYKTAWEVTKDPTETILYVSATAALAEKQLHLVKLILTSPTYRKYWPDMVHLEEGKRERWTVNEIAVDHPARKLEGIRDPTVKAAGLTGNITGFHATKIKLDDIVVPRNAYTEDGRAKVAALVSQLASIEEPESEMDCVGTRYHPKDQYETFLAQTFITYDDNGEVVREEPLWDLYMRVVEEGNVFLWPRSRRSDGKEFGFNANVLSKIKAKYTDVTQFWAQYYNNPNMGGGGRIAREKFQYYDRRFLENTNDRWEINGKPLNIYAGMDFAFSLSRKADFSCLVVVGVDEDNQYYLLDIFRFRTDKISRYFDAILESYRKWGYRKIRCETTTAQAVIVRDLKEQYIVPNNLPIIVDEFHPTRNEGTKEERIAATLEPKYENNQIWHYKGGEVNLLEDELVAAKPPHDDIKDGLTAAIDIAVPPMKRRHRNQRSGNVIFNNRFGGVAAR